MFFKFPKDDKNFKWTQHIKDKMLFYRISEQRIRAILKSSDRREDGIAPNTSAVMKRNDKPFGTAQGKPKKQEEIWVMYQDKLKVKSEKLKGSDGKLKNGGDSRFEVLSSKLIMISAWRYPGKSKPGKEIPIPEDILSELGMG